MDKLTEQIEQEKLYRLQIDKIYDYTKFHIGIYGTLITGMITLEVFDKIPADFTKIIFIIIISLFFISAMCGAIIASSIFDMYRNYEFWKINSSQTFWTTRIGPLKSKWLFPSNWAMIEHISFWFGITIAVAGAICKAL